VVEHNFFHPHYCFMDNSLLWMLVVTDSHWVNCLVEGDVPQFYFYDNSELMGEDQNDMMDWYGNNDD